MNVRAVRQGSVYTAVGCRGQGHTVVGCIHAAARRTATVATVSYSAAGPPMGTHAVAVMSPDADAEVEADAEAEAEGETHAGKDAGLPDGPELLAAGAPIACFRPEAPAHRPRYIS